MDLKEKIAKFSKLKDSITQKIGEVFSFNSFLFGKVYVPVRVRRNSTHLRRRRRY